MDIVIEKLSIISDIDLVDDVKSIIKNVWLKIEYIIILPPTFEEWHKLLNNKGEWGCTYVDINGISFNRIFNTGEYLNHYIGKIFTFYKINCISLAVMYGSNNIKYENIWYDKKSFDQTGNSNIIVPIYYFPPK
jgi:hypothetical protein